MKRLISVMLALCLMLSLAVCPAGAEDLFLDDEFLDDEFLDDEFLDDEFLDDEASEEEPEREPLPEVLKVGSSNKVSGCFFTDLWSGNTSDIDVRAMLHGLNTTAWINETEYAVNPTVVENELSENNADGSVTYYITIRDDLKYSDGSAITAADYVFSVLYQTSPYLTELGAAETAYTYLKGYKAYHSGQSQMFEGVRLLGTYIFALTVDAQYLPFFYEESYIDVIPYPIESLLGDFEVHDAKIGAYISGKHEGLALSREVFESRLFGENGYMTYPDVVSGPYTLAAYNAETGYVEFVKNPYFPGNYEGAVPQFEKVNLEYSDTANAAEDFANGRFHIINKCVSMDVIAGLMATGAEFTAYSRRGLGYAVFSCDSPIMSDVNVRKAISSALDRDSYVSELLGSFGMVAYGYYGIGQWMARAATGAITIEGLTEKEQAQWDEVSLESLNTTPYDLEAACALLDEAQWNKAADGSEYTEGLRYRELDGELAPLSLTIVISAESKAGKLLVEYLTEAFNEIGAELTVKELAFNDMLESLYTAGERDADIYFLGTNFDRVFNPVMTFGVADRYQNLANTSHIKDETLEQLIKEMNSTEPLDILGYYLSWYKFQQRFTELMPMLPIYSDVYVDFYTDMLQDYNITPCENWVSAIFYAYFGYTEDEEEDSFLKGGEDELGGDDDLFL